MESSLNIQKIVKPSFAVIGIEGSTDDGEGFIPMLWSDANAHFDEVSPVASRDENGAVQEFTDPKTQQEYLYFPIRAL